MKNLLISLMVLGIAACAWGNGVSLNSPGTRALSMAGAVISNVNNYSVAYWNPAGLMNTEGISASFFLTDIIPLASYEYESAGIKADSKVNHYLAPNAAFLWTCKLNNKLRMGLSAIVPAGLGTEWNGEDFVAFAGPSVLVDATGTPIPNPYTGDPTIPNVLAGTTFDWEGKIGVMNISLSTAYRLGEKLNVGGALHLVYGNMTMKRGVDMLTQYGFTAGTGLPVDTLIQGNDSMLDTQYSEESSGWGYGFGFGLQYMLDDAWTIGASIRTKMKVGFSGDAEFGSTKYSFDRDITWPLWYGGGLSFKPSEKLLLAAEAQYWKWSETEEYLIAEYETIGKDSLTLKWNDAVQIRLGAEYQAWENLALRCGFYIDPAPGPNRTQTILIPNTDFLGFTLGAGYTMNRLSIDATLEYLSGRDRKISENVAMPGVGMPGVHKLNIWAPSIAVTYKFK